MSEKDNLLQLIDDATSQVKTHEQNLVRYKASDKASGLHAEFIVYLNELKAEVSQKELPANYLQQFQGEITSILQYFNYSRFPAENIVSALAEQQIKDDIERQMVLLEPQLEMMKFNLDFFKKLEFLSGNIVAVGANGSGKTTLASKLKTHLPQNGLVVSAQKILIIPTFSGISNIDITRHNLENYQSNDKSNRVTYDSRNDGSAYSLMKGLGEEFKYVLDNLMSARSAERNKFFEGYDKNNPPDKPFTRFDQVLKIWNSLITHRTLKCEDGINLILDGAGVSVYPAYQMSDGEKVALFLIAHVLQAPQSGFIIVDEPETYLHKTIAGKLWDVLESERKDCIFIYLTHDLDFAANRTTAKKVWVKSYTAMPQQKWEIEEIPENDIPQELILELLGSRRNILFCEGKANSQDKQIYEILFPHFTIKPLGSSRDVINHTKAYNHLPIKTTTAFGIVDSDFRQQTQGAELEKENLYLCGVAEIENLFFDEEFLSIFAREVKSTDNQSVQKIKGNVVEHFKRDIELQASRYVSAKIDYHFKELHVSKGNDLPQVKSNYSKFSDGVKVEEWYEARKKELEIFQNDYSKIITTYNNKGLKKFANECFKISDFTNRAIKVLKENECAQNALRKYFHADLIQK